MTTILKTMMTLMLAALGLLAQPLASLPQHLVDNTTGELILKANPEHEPRFRFRCLKTTDEQSCTTLATRTVDGKKAFPIVRKLIEDAVKSQGISGVRVSFVYEQAAGFAGGIIARVETARGARDLNAIFVALWLMLPGETDATVRDRIKRELAEVI